MNSKEHAGLWAAYLDTIIEFSDPDGSRLVFLRAGLPMSPEPLSRLSSFAATLPAWVITAWNPESELVPAEQNAAAHRELLADVEAAGLVALPAVGMSRDRSWSEESVLVVGASRQWVLGIAEKFKQNAVFRWTPESLDVVGGADPWVRTRAIGCVSRASRVESVNADAGTVHR